MPHLISSVKHSNANPLQKFEPVCLFRICHSALGTGAITEISRNNECYVRDTWCSVEWGL